ncbi:unnamed protein product [Toxocara canis]|uniref:Membralin n=1 Tax=Toxocara canis TaxID=6265 RepID=A0A183UL89_TOXCA|nr:unnamed protein product [Toxocara canis]
MDHGAGVPANGVQPGGPPRPAQNDALPAVVAVDTPQPPQQQQQQNNQFGAVRDRLFHAMLVRMALSYTRHVPRTARRLIEFSALLTAISLLGLMMYVHVMFGKADNTCLSHLVDTWPRDGVLRVEVINNLDKFNAYQERIAEEWQHRHAESNSSTPFDLKRILIEGPAALPKELRSKPKYPTKFVFLFI